MLTPLYALRTSRSSSSSTRGCRAVRCLAHCSATFTQYQDAAELTIDVFRRWLDPAQEVDAGTPAEAFASATQMSDMTGII